MQPGRLKPSLVRPMTWTMPWAGLIDRTTECRLGRGFPPQTPPAFLPDLDGPVAPMRGSKSRDPAWPRSFRIVHLKVALLRSSIPRDPAEIMSIKWRSTLTLGVLVLMPAMTFWSRILASMVRRIFHKARLPLIAVFANACCQDSTRRYQAQEADRPSRGGCDRGGMNFGATGRFLVPNFHSVVSERHCEPTVARMRAL